jgi:uncharacterized membrane protein YdjX (TVP38/TMEM64 family)
MKPHWKTFSWAFWLSTTAILGSMSAVTVAYQYEDSILEWQPWVWAVFFALMALAMLGSLISNTFVSLISGYFLGFAAFFPVWLTYIAAVLGGYYVSQKIDKGSIRSFLAQYPKWDAWQKNLHQKSFGLVFWARLSPLLPFAVMNLALVSQGVRLRVYLIGSAMGAVPRLLVTIAATTQAKSIKDALSGKGTLDAWQILGMVMSLVAVLALFYLLKKSFQNPELPAK